MVEQVSIILPPFARGVHLITPLVINQLPPLPNKGLLNLFIQHTSAAISLNENADPSVREDVNEFLNRIAPENEPWYRHVAEGDDDMPAHIKAMLVGFSLTIPISNSSLCMGTWQGIYLFEFRNHGGARRLLATILC